MKKNNNILTSTLNKVFNAKIFSNKIFNNQITLFIVSAIAFISLYRYIIMYEFSAVLLFFIIAGLAYSFTKNMTIVLGSAFLATFIVSMFKGFKEGNENMVESSGNSVTTGTGTGTGNEKKTTQSAQTTQATPATGATGATSPPDITTIPGAASLQQSLLSGSLATPNIASPPKDNYQNQIPLTPGLYNMPNKEQMTKQLGKATETEQAYDNLEKIMGSKNIQAMSSDTKDLIRQQNDLIKQLKAMTPALNEAMTALGGLDLSKLTNMFNKREEHTE